MMCFDCWLLQREASENYFFHQLADGNHAFSTAELKLNRLAVGKGGQNLHGLLYIESNDDTEEERGKTSITL